MPDGPFEGEESVLLLEREVTQAGGTYAFCDTDSLAIVSTTRGANVPCPNAEGETINALSRRKVERILSRFDDLNPYDRSFVPSLWDAKNDSLARPVTCFAISAKRYALYRERSGGIEFERVVDRDDAASGSDESVAAVQFERPLEDWSEHGLGLYLDPRDPDDPRRDEKRRRIWMREAWKWVIQNDPSVPLPAWAARPALARFTVSGPKLQAWFSGFDGSVPRTERIRPGAFGLIGHPLGLLAGIATEARPARAYESDPQLWERGPWYDRRTGAEINVTTLSPGTDPEGFSRELARGAIRIQTLGDVLARFRLHPEHKSLGPQGRWTDEETRGLLQRRAVSSAPVLTDLTGKEGNKIVERLTGEVSDVKDYRTDYGARADRWRFLAVPVLLSMQRDLGSAELAKQVGVHRTTLERALRREEPVVPHASTRIRYLETASVHVAPVLSGGGVSLGRDAYGILWCYSEAFAVGLQRVCEVCGRPISHPLAKYCGEACKKREYRTRQRVK